MVVIDDEYNLRLFLSIKLKDFTNENYLKKLYRLPDNPTKSKIRNYNLFIDYMTQGFNRQRKHLCDEYGLSIRAIHSISIREKWTKMAKIWENEVIKAFIDWMNIPLFDSKIKYQWSQLPNEKNYPYFCFLCYLYLNRNGNYSQPTTAKIMTSCGLRIVSQTLNQYSRKFHWVKRVEDYNKYTQAKEFNLVSAVAYSVSESNNEIPVWEVINWINNDKNEFNKTLNVFNKYCNNLMEKHKLKGD
ncbi:MAG: hypothetical protein BZ138_08140 [Methanosphaera sp. rholeuAM270]|nr:MAG: hypothetical protein BZ138_08140 [Methanosphaera sp. rholeuAM270]